jgi:hypothetical protein
MPVRHDQTGSDFSLAVYYSLSASRLLTGSVDTPIIFKQMFETYVRPRVMSSKAVCGITTEEFNSARSGKKNKDGANGNNQQVAQGKRPESIPGSRICRFIQQASYSGLLSDTRTKYTPESALQSLLTFHNSAVCTVVARM